MAKKAVRKIRRKAHVFPFRFSLFAAVVLAIFALAGGGFYAIQSQNGVLGAHTKAKTKAITNTVYIYVNSIPHPYVFPKTVRLCFAIYDRLGNYIQTNMNDSNCFSTFPKQIALTYLSSSTPYNIVGEFFTGDPSTYQLPTTQPALTYKKGMCTTKNISAACTMTVIIPAKDFITPTPTPPCKITDTWPVCYMHKECHQLTGCSTRAVYFECDPRSRCGYSSSSSSPHPLPKKTGSNLN